MVDEIDPEVILKTVEVLLQDILDELVLQKAILNDIKTNTTPV